MSNSVSWVNSRAFEQIDTVWYSRARALSHVRERLVACSGLMEFGHQWYISTWLRQSLSLARSSTSECCGAYRSEYYL